MIKERLAKLVDVKSIVTILLAVCFFYLAVIGKITSEQFLTTFTVVISFYFGTQSKKGEKA